MKINEIADNLKSFKDEGVVHMIPDYFEEQEYRDYDAASQSFIKRQDKSIQEMHKKPDPDSPYIRIGNIVDDMLSMRKEAFSNKYLVSKAEKPTEKLKLFIDKVVDIVITEYESDIFHLHDDLVHTVCERASSESDYGKKMKISTLFSKIKDFKDYADELYASIDKISITQEEHKTALSMVQNMKTSQYTSHYFYTEEKALENNVLVIYQLPIFFTYYGIRCKVLLDMVIVQFDNQGEIECITPFDFKTTSRPILDTIPNILNFRYDIQAYLYTEALREVTYWHGGIVEPFKFIFCESFGDHNADVLETTEDFMLHAEKGNDRNVKGIFELMDYYKFYQENGYQVEKDRFRENCNEPLKIKLRNGFII